MPAPMPSWLQVRPTDYLAASQAGANVGLAIAKLRQEQQEQRLRIRATSEELAADRQASYDRLREQLNAQRELKMADLAAEQQRDSARILDSNAGRDLQMQGLDFRRSQEEFDQDQARRKLLLSAESTEQEGRLLRGVAKDRSPAGILSAASDNPMAKSALPLTSRALTLEAANKLREEQAKNPSPTASMRDAREGRTKIESWMKDGSRLDLLEGAKLLGLRPDVVTGEKKELTTTERNTIIGKVQSLMLLRQKQTVQKKKDEIDEMISEWKKRYPDIFTEGKTFQSGKYKVTL